MSDLEEFKQTFFQESQELLEDMEGDLLKLQDGSFDDETINAIFRAVHSVKGGAGAFALTRLVEFAHVFETLLDNMRNGRHPVDDPTIDVLLKAGDKLTDLVGFYRDGAEIPAGTETQIAAQLEALISSGDEADDTAGEVAPADFDDLDFTPLLAVDMDDEDEASDESEELADFEGIDFTPLRAGDMDDLTETKRIFTIQFAPKPDLYRRANEPLLLIRELGRLGNLTVDCKTESIPPLEDIDPQSAYFSWEITLTDTESTREDLEEIFEFVIDDCELEINENFSEADLAGVEQLGAPETEIETIATPPEPDPRASMDGSVRAAPDDVVADVASEPDLTPAPSSAPAPVPVAVAAPAAAENKKPTGPASPAKTENKPSVMIRVDLDKVDKVVNMVGELVITQAMLSQIVEELPEGNYTNLWRGLEELMLQTRELQENVMSIRAQPVGTIFQRLPRLIREVAEQTGKKVKLETSGEATEIDKTVVEKLSDPLTHMLRNAVDHGIESPERRLEAGKSETGTVHLSADQKGGRIVIELSDDGGGIDAARIHAKAVESGVIEPGAVMSDEAIYDLIFHPGLSTSEQVSSISGRGVGMDVVRRNIQALGGRVTIRSAIGKGSTFQLTLPLTLAVMDGMVVRVGTETYILPLGSIIECFRPQASDLNYVVNIGEVLRLRGEVVPLIALARLFSVEDGEPDPQKGVVIVADTEDGGPVGIVVDEIKGQQQVVVKSIEENFRAIDGVAAATILGNGEVALILDLDGVSMSANSKRPMALAG